MNNKNDSLSYGETIININEIKKKVKPSTENSIAIPSTKTPKILWRKSLNITNILFSYKSSVPVQFTQNDCKMIQQKIK